MTDFQHLNFQIFDKILLSVEEKEVVYGGYYFDGFKIINKMKKKLETRLR